MRMRSVILAGLLALLFGAETSQAQFKPTAVLRVASVDTLSAKGKYLAKLIDQTDLYNQAEGFLKAFTGPQGVEGLDTKNPLGMYGKLGPNGIDSEVVVLIPVTDGDRFLAFLKKQNVVFEKQKNGAYKFDIPGSPFPAFLRFANGYGYLTVQNDETIDEKNLLNPKTVLAPETLGLAALTLDAEQIPGGMRALVLQALEDQSRQQKQNLPPGLNEAQRQGQIAGIDLFVNLVKTVVNEGGPLTLQLDLNETKQELKLGIGFSGKAGTGLARTLAETGKTPSVAAGALPVDGVVRWNLNTSLPSAIRDLFVTQAEKGLKEGLEKETDPRKRKLGQLVSDALLPTLRAGNIDVGAALVPTVGGKNTLVLGARVARGSDIEKAVKEVAGMLDDNEKRAVGLTIDLDKAEGVNIHGARGGAMDAEGKRLFGDGTIHFAVREDALILAFGDGSLGAVRSALANKPRVGGVAGATMQLSKLVALLPAEQKQRLEPVLKKVLEGADQGRDTIALTLDGGQELKLDLTVPAPVIRFLGELVKMYSKGA